MKGGWSGMRRRIINLETTVIEQEKPMKIPEAWHKAL